MRRRVRLFY
jgi:hypothetical protein